MRQFVSDSAELPMLPVRPAVLALVVALVWGTNPVAIHRGLEQFPPLGGAAIRFLMVAVPLAIFVPRPTTKLPLLAAYGFLLGAGLGLNNVAMAGHITPGLASLLLQVQVAMTIGLELFIERRWPSLGQILALVLCGSGVATVMLTADEATDPIGVLLMMAAAVCWAIANMIVRSRINESPVSMMIWSAFFAFLLLSLLSLMFDGWDTIAASVLTADSAGWMALIWQAFASSLFGYASWNFLLSRHSAARVAPFALLVPIFGMAASAIFLGEIMEIGKIVAGALIVCGMGFAIFQRRGRLAPLR